MSDNNQDVEADLFADLYEPDDSTTRAPPPPPPPPAAAASAPAPAAQPEKTVNHAPAPAAPAAAPEYQLKVNDSTERDDRHVSEAAAAPAAAPPSNNAMAIPSAHMTPDVVKYPTRHDGPIPNSGPPEPAHQGTGIKEDGKMFIGGLNWETTDQSLKEYFSQYGEVSECTVMRDNNTGRSRGFGFLTFSDPRCVNTVMVKEHYLDGKIIDPKRAIPREEQEKTSKIFVGGVSQEATEEIFQDFFAKFGNVLDATLMMDKDTGRPRGFGFVTFDSERAVEATLAGPLEILGKPVDVKKAQPRNMRDGNENIQVRRNFNDRGPDAGPVNNMAGPGDASQMQQPAMPGMPNGMTPQMMAQYWQSMQQYFLMIRQQQQQMMAAQNPSMGMGMMMEGGGGGGRGANPAMMQQMQPQLQQQQQLAQQYQQQMGAGAVPPGQGQSPERESLSPSISQQTHQQSPVPQYPYPNMQQPSAPSGYQQTPPPNPLAQQQYNNGMPSMSARPSVSSFDGPIPPDRTSTPMSAKSQPRTMTTPTGPPSAPPLNAPTGPRNRVNRANYRGGGASHRGGPARGFHPYGR